MYNVHNFSSCEGEPEELIKHGLRALRETLPNEQELTTKVLSNAFISSGILLFGSNARKEMLTGPLYLDFTHALLTYLFFMQSVLRQISYHNLLFMDVVVT